MAATLAITHYATVDRDARQKVINGLSKVARFAHEQEAGIAQYAVTLPRIENDETSVYVIEEYADQAAVNKHLGSQPVAEFLALISSTAALAAPPRVLTYRNFTSYSRASVLDHPDPYILVAAWDYKEGTGLGALEGWRKYNAGCQRDEPGTMVQVLGQDERDADKVGGVMAFDSEKYFWDTHVAGEHTQSNKAKFGDIRNKTELKYYKLVGGFMHKAQRESRM